MHYRCRQYYLGKWLQTEDWRQHRNSYHPSSSVPIPSGHTSASCSSGFFGWIEDHGEGIVIKDTKFNNAHVEGNHNVGVVAGYIYGTINGCEVSNSTIIAHNANNDANGDKVGGIAGFVGEDAFIDNNRLLIAK